jgi:DHA3 family macrolide efflux protein-like MFS transporter
MAPEDIAPPGPPVPAAAPRRKVRRMTATPTTRSILRDPTFARLWFVQAATQIGGNMALYALTVLVFQTTRSNTAVGALVASFVLPQIVLSPFAGVVVDRLDLRWALVGPNIARSVMTAGLALTGANIPVLLALNLGISLTSVALTPAEGSMIPRVVPRAQLQTAMGIFNLTLQASFALGFAFLGPLLVTVAGPSATLAVVTALYVAATVACIGLPSAPPLGGAHESGREAVLRPIHELQEGLGVIRRDRDVSRPILHQAAGTSVAGVLGVLGPGLAATIGLEPDQLAVIVVPFGIGVVIGVLSLRRLGDLVPRRRAAEGGLVVFGLLTASLALAGGFDGALQGIGVSVLPFVIAVAVGAGAAYAVVSVSAQTALIESMPSQLRGRIFGVLASIVSAASLVPTLVAGPVADRVSASVVIGIVGMGVMGVGLWSARRFGSAGPDEQRT